MSNTNRPRTRPLMSSRRRVPVRFAVIAVVAALALVSARTWAQRADRPVGFSNLAAPADKAAVNAAVVAADAGLAANAGQPQIQTSGAGISAEALAQIEALMKEKEARSPAERKIDSQLLYARRMQQGLPIADGVQTLDVDLPYTSDGHVLVEVRATVTAGLLAGLKGLGSEIVATSPGVLQLRLDLAQIEAIAAQPDVLFVQPKQGAITARAGAPRTRDQEKTGGERRAAAGAAVGTALSELVGTGQGSVSSQADVTHRTAVFRGLTGVTGAGVKIGVLSDGVAHLADAQASGDLGPVTVLPGQAGPLTGDEGTAMLELIHDLAPGAQLYFATAFTSITSFAQNIRDLRAAGCDIIVDDVFYFVETPFQDGQDPSVVSATNGGVVTQAVKDVTAAGAFYFSSAGNAGNLNDNTSGVWEGDFADGGATAAPLPAGNLHNFAAAQPFNNLTLAGSGPINLYWSDPLGGSANDYDLFRLNTAGTAIAASSTNIQSGTQDPYEQMTSSTSSPRIVIVKKTGALGRFLHLNTNRGRLGTPTAGQTHGHSATSAPFSFGVAAVNAGANPPPPVIPASMYPNPFSTSNVIETFSSDGPRRIFFQADGTAITGGAVLQKPDLTAADGVLVTGAGGFPSPFFGTSAAAPNAAAIMALLKAANPAFTQAQLRSALLTSALDIEAAGIDRDSGVGIVMAQAPQPGCTFSFASPVSVGIAGGPASASLTASLASCNWVAWSNIAWVSVSGSGVGTGSGVVPFTVAANPGSTRSGTIMVQGGQIVTVTQAGTPPTPFDNNTPVPIADNTTQESSLTVSGVTGAIANLSASFYLTHTFDGDLTVSLVGPDATTIKLTEHRGSSGDNYGSACTPLTSRTTFDDSAAVAVRSGAPPFVGNFGPEQPLSAFNGKSGTAVNGAWKLRVSDSATLDVGTLLCWSLYIHQNALPTISAITSKTTPVSTPITVNFSVGDAESGAAAVSVFAGSSNTTLVPNANLVLSGTAAGRAVTITPVAGRNGVTLITIGAGDGTSFVNTTFTLIVGSPARTGDFNADGLVDITVFRPSTGSWFVRGVSTTTWGGGADIPVAGDYDADGKTDVAVYRPSTGTWFILRSGSGTGLVTAWGGGADIPVPGDYDGDGKTDLAVFRPSTGAWWVLQSSTGVGSVTAWGGGADTPVARDYDGDGKTDLAVFRPSTGAWYVLQSSTGVGSVTTWGGGADIPVAADYDGDNKADIAVFRPSTGVWFTLFSSTATGSVTTWGGGGDIPVPGEYDGDGKTDIAVYRPSTGNWFIITSSTATGVVITWGGGADIPILKRP